MLVFAHRPLSGTKTGRGERHEGHAADLGASHVAFHPFRICGSVLRMKRPTNFQFKKRVRSSMVRKRFATRGPVRLRTAQ
jgi:uncharacterized glyoxalase superfamily metalloenzyme YdcJ